MTFNLIDENYQESDLPFEQCNKERRSRHYIGKCASVMAKLCLVGSSFAGEKLQGFVCKKPWDSRYLFHNLGCEQTKHHEWMCWVVNVFYKSQTFKTKPKFDICLNEGDHCSILMADRFTSHCVCLFGHLWVNQRFHSAALRFFHTI